MSTQTEHTRPVYRFADLVLDSGRRQVFRGDDVVPLTGKSFDVLAALVTAAPNSLSHDDLIDAVWRGSVVSQATVAKRIELIRQALDDDSGAPRYVALVRGYGYRLIPTVTSGEHAAEKSAAPRRRRRWIALASLLLVGVAVAVWLRSRKEPPPERSIAVLPFASLSNDPRDQAFALGLTDELCHALAREARLEVVGRASSYRYAERTEDARTIGSVLGAAHLLEGSVRRSGEQLRVTAQLVSTRDGLSLWSKSYDRKMADIIDIQIDIARSVARELQVTLGTSGPRSSPDPSVINPATYALYLRGVSLSPFGKVRDLGEAQRLLEAVTEQAPGFAPGWVRLAAIHGRRLLGRDEGYDKSPEESMSIAMSAITNAAALDPDNGEIFAALGGSAWVFEGDAAKAGPLIERAIELAPHDLDILSFAADFAKFIGRLEDARELEELIVARDPLCTLCRARLARSYLLSNEPARAAREYETLRELEDERHWSYGIALLMLGRTQDALESFRRFRGPESLRLLGEAAAQCDLGAPEAATTLAQLEERWSTQRPQDVAKALAHCERDDAAFAVLNRSLPAGILQLQTEFSSPLYSRLRADPRWPELMRSVGRSPEQIAAIPFSLERARAAIE